MPDKSDDNIVATTSSESVETITGDGQKRQDYLRWQEYFMALAFLSAKRSKDPNTQVGACIVDSDNRVVSIGYNGFPCGIHDDELPWGKQYSISNYEDNESLLHTKYPYVCHAELNAVLNSNRIFRSQAVTVYVTMFPCHECAKLFVQAGVRFVVYYSDRYKDKLTGKAAQIIFNKSGIKYEQYSGQAKKVILDFDQISSPNTISSDKYSSDQKPIDVVLHLSNHDN
ncbi:hypothetical protein GJ496_001372 [Pomphorhynchus laevis]|nr:hypothetical protein GJ496_001372 [Pomphorhynchus laevis]